MGWNHFEVQKMNILIVGGTGVLSSAVTAEALKKGIAVTMINRGNRPIPEGVEHIKSDRNNYSYLAEVLSGRSFDAVMDFLLLSDEDTRKSVGFYSRFTKQYFFISSCAVYNTVILNGRVGNEDSPKELPVWFYSKHKWASEKLVMNLFSTKNNYTIIRPCVTYDNTRIPYGISPTYGYHWTLASRILKNKPIITWNQGDNKCNMTRVEDFAVGVVGLIGNQAAYGEAFNVCGDETPSFRDVLKCMGNYLKKQVITIDIDSEFYALETPSRYGEIIEGRSVNSLNSNLKLKSAIPSFKQTICLKEGVEMTMRYYEQHNYEKGIDWKFDGDTDRIILKWCKKHGIDCSVYNLGFVDYLGTATISNKIEYYEERYKDVFFVKLLLLPKRFVQKVIRKVKFIKSHRNIHKNV